jgi:uncharacterized membrane protein
MQVRTKYIGILVGLGIGWIIVQHGLIKGIFVLAVALVGWTIGRIMDGEIDVIEFLRRRSGEEVD